MESLDAALLATINDVLLPQTAAICRPAGYPSDMRWRTCAQLIAGVSVTSGEWTPSVGEALPLLEEFPLRQAALSSRQTQQSTTGGCTTVFPMQAAAGSAGVLEVATETPLSAETQHVVSGILRLYGNFAGLLDYGERDSLTSLLNRKTFDGAFLKASIEQQQLNNKMDDELCSQEDRRVAISAGSYWLAMIDIDHFKRVNDNFGHLIGDEVLLLLARLMRSHFRFHDRLYRFGGEEFVALMRCQGEEQAAQVLERLRGMTEEYPFPQVGTITISVGFTEIRAGDAPSDAFERADQAVYYAKEHGRNQVCSFSALCASGELADQDANVGDVELF